MNVLSLISLVVATSLPAFALAQTSTPRPAKPAASQPAPAAAGPLRILLVDDDFSENNNDPSDKRQTPSDRIFRQVVADAVGGNAKAWEIEYVKPYASGPGIERLRPFSLIVWYTGAIYGGNADNSGVLSIEDEKTVRRYLEEVGGTVILFSPGYLSKVQGASGTWEKTDWKFLTEVVGLRGGVGLAQRFLAGTVTAPDGARFNVDKGSAVESQFSLVNPARATVLFSTVLASAKPGSSAAPVATSHAYGKGRFIYVGFSFENLAAAEQAPAFGKLLAASGLQSPANPAMSASRSQPQEKRQAAADPGRLSVQTSSTHVNTTVSWTLQTGPTVNTPILGSEQTVQKAPATKAPAAPAPAPTVRVHRYEKYSSNRSSGWENVGVFPGYSQAWDEHYNVAIERRYRVTVTEASGETHVKEVQAVVLPIRDPERLTAMVQSDRSVILSWPEVPGVTKYRVLGTQPSGRGRVGPTIVDRATEWRSPPLNGAKRIWEVTSLFERQDGEFVVLTDQDKVPWTETEGPYWPSDYGMTRATLTIHTGNDNKEAPSSFGATLYVNGGDTREDDGNQNPYRLQHAAYLNCPTGELKVNSSAECRTPIPTDKSYPKHGVNYPSLATFQQYGLRIRIKYLPNFPLDAWKIDRVTLTVNFQAAQQVDSKTVTFSNVAKLLTGNDSQVDLVADGSFRPIP